MTKYTYGDNDTVVEARSYDELSNRTKEEIV